MVAPRPMVRAQPPRTPFVREGAETPYTEHQMQLARLSAVAIAVALAIGCRSDLAGPSAKSPSSPLRRSAADGIRLLHLQVEDDNDRALRLYERLGFETHSAYAYLTAPHG